MTDPASLQNLQDIIEPATVGFWPPASGVWLLLALALVWTGVGLAWLWLRWRQNAYRRAGMQELREIRQRLCKDDPPKAIQQLAALLKRVALTAFPRNRVASLSGANWLAFLDATMDGGTFETGPGRLFTEAVYRPTAVPVRLSDRQMEALFDLAGAWINRHRSTLPVDLQNH